MNGFIRPAPCGWLSPKCQMLETALALIRIHKRKCKACCALGN